MTRISPRKRSIYSPPYFPPNTYIFFIRLTIGVVSGVQSVVAHQLVIGFPGFHMMAQLPLLKGSIFYPFQTIVPSLLLAS